MDNQLLNFLNGNANVAKVETIISRETTSTGMQFIHITIGDKLVYNFWHNPNKIKDSEQKPKSTGGKKPYLMLMMDQLEKLKGVANREELVGFLVCLGNNIEWNTGKLIHKRSKKKLKYDDLQKMFSCGKRKFDRIIRDLKDNDLLTSNQEGYFISSALIKKGKSIK